MDAIRKVDDQTSADRRGKRVGGMKYRAVGKAKEGEVPDRFELAVSTVFFVNERGIDVLRHLEGSSVRSVEILWAHGYGGREAGWQEGISRHPRKEIDEISRILGDIGIGCWSMHTPFGAGYDPSSSSERVRKQTEDAWRRCIEYLKCLRGSVLVVHPGYEAVADKERPRRIDDATRMLRRLSSECAAAGLRLAIENLTRSKLANSAAELSCFLAKVDSAAAGVCLDFAHAFVTEGVAQMVEALGSRIITVHICDNTLPDQERTCWPMEHGKALIDWESALRALRRTGYRGPAVYETYAATGQIVAAVKRLEENYTLLRTIWDRC